MLTADIERSHLMARAETATEPDRIADIHTRLADIDAYSAGQELLQFYLDLVSTTSSSQGLS